MANSDGSFIRWQGIAITQMGYAVNFILTLATAAVGFLAALVKDRDFTPACWGKCFVVLAGACLLVSIGLGILCIINRLVDFRKTKDIAKDREDLSSAHSERAQIQRRLDKRRDETDKFGKRTWVIFWWQIGTFGGGILLLVFAVTMTYSDKLFLRNLFADGGLRSMRYAPISLFAVITYGLAQISINHP
jgi:hypothetical protein